MHSKLNDFGAYHKLAYGNLLATKITAALATLDAVEYESASINRDGYQSATVGLMYSATLTCGVTEPLKATLSISDSEAGSTWTTYAALLSSVAIASATGTGVYAVNVDLGSYSKYVKFKYKPDLMKTGTDTCITGFVVDLGGPTVLPAT